MNRILTFVFFIFLLPNFIFSQSKVGYQIKVSIDGFEGKEAYLGYYFGDKQFLKDTAYAEANGQFYFEGNEPLSSGMYMVVLPPDNQFFQVMIEEGADNQWFSMSTAMADLSGKMKVEGSADNERFYGYLNYLAAKRPEAEEIKNKLNEEGLDEKKKAKLESKLESIDAEVKKYQEDIVKNHANSLTAAIIKANQPLDIPVFEGPKEEAEKKSFYWMRGHWFDPIDLTDERMVRTPFLFPKVTHFVEKMTVQHPDSIIIGVDQILEKMRPSEETFKFYLIHFLNTYAKSKLVGMDAVYVHIVDKYYRTGQAPWTDEEQLEKILENAKKLKPLLIGKTAPDIEMQTQKGEKVTLHGFESPYTVLFFWDPDCGHCKKSMPEMVEFGKNYKDKGVSVFSICTALVVRDDEGNFSMEEVDKCWTTIEEREMNVFFNSVDPYHRSRYKTVYDIRSTPQIYVLDKDKKILSKRIGADQLSGVLDHLLKNN